MFKGLKYKIIYIIALIVIQLLMLNTCRALAIESINIQNDETTIKNDIEKDETTEEKKETDETIENKVELSGVYVIKTVLNSELCLDVSEVSTSDCANIQLYKYVGENQQKFRIEHIENGEHTITAIHSGKALDVALAKKMPGTNVQQYEYNGTDAQKWIIKQNKNGNYVFISKCNGLYLNVEDKKANNCTNINVDTGNNSENQMFSLEEIKIPKGKQTIPDGTYEIRTALNEKYVLDISEASKSSGANVQIYQYVKENQQKFKVKYVGDGYYTIIALHSGKALDVENASQISGANIWQYDANNSDAQKWIIYETEDGMYNIISKCNWLYLNVSGSIARNSANIQVTKESNSSAQKFKFVKANETNGKTIVGEKTISNGIYAIKTIIDENYVLDVSEASKSNCANIQLYKYVEENQQKFYVEYIGNGEYTVTSLHSGKALDVANAGQTAGTNVWQYEFNNSEAQKWVIKKTDDEYYYIISKNRSAYRKYL